MIDEVVKIHDQFTIEIKTGFRSSSSGKNEFSLNTWFYIPSSLDVNRHTYTKAMFYRDLKVNTRLITPIYTLREIAEDENSPLKHLKKTIDKTDRTGMFYLEEYEYQIKMFNSILKSSLRSEINRISSQLDFAYITILVESYVDQIDVISKKYRGLYQKVEELNDEKALELFVYGDEFISHLIESHSYKLIKSLSVLKIDESTAFINMLINLIKGEVAYQKLKGFLLVSKKDKVSNSRLVFKRSVLKKYMESELFLSVQKKEDAFLLKQFIYSLAAGLSMIFATVIAFSFQQKFGNYTMPFFTALVVGYMLKDRIKELGRYYFAHKFSSRYYDLKTKLAINNKRIGWCKDACDFISEDRVPHEVRHRRSRTPLLETNQKYNKEEIMLYRMSVETNNTVINKCSKYQVDGLNRIVRFNLSSFIHKMDNPEVKLSTLSEDGSIETVNGERIYYVNLILEMSENGKLSIDRYLVALNRNGILDIHSL